MSYTIDIETFKALVKGEFTKRECTECHRGTLYIDGEWGDVITRREYNELVESGDSDVYTADCGDCFGLGYLVEVDL